MSNTNEFIIDTQLNTDGAIDNAKALTKALKQTADSVKDVSKETKTSMKEAIAEFEKANKQYDKQIQKVEILKQAVEDASNSMPLSKEYVTETNKLNRLLEQEATLFKQLGDAEANKSGLSAKAQKNAINRTKNKLVTIQQEITAQRELVSLVADDNKYDTSKADAKLEKLEEEKEKLREIADIQRDLGQQAVDTIKSVVSPSVDDLVDKISQASEQVADEIREDAIKDNWLQKQFDTSNAIDFEKFDIDTTPIDEYTTRMESLRGIISNLKYNLTEAFTPVHNAIAENERLANTFATMSEMFGKLSNPSRVIFTAIATTSRFAVTGVKALAEAIAKVGVQAGQFVGSKIASAFKSIGHNALNSAKNILTFGKANKQNNGVFKHGFLTMLKYGFGIRSLFFLFNRLRKSAKEGLGNLAKEDSKTNASISGLVSALDTLKNAFATAFSPILNIVAPILTGFINQLVNVANTIGAVLSKLTGNGTFQKAIGVQKDYAKSLDKSGKSAKNLKLSIDEFNDVSDNSGGGGGETQDMFQETAINDAQSEMADKIKSMWANADFTELGSTIGGKLADSLDNIDWNSIKAKAGKVGKSVATLLNGFFEFPDLGYKVGKSVAEGFNTLIAFTENFVENFHFDSIGKFFGDGLNGTFENLNWQGLANTISKGLSGIFNSLSTFFKTVKWQDLGQTLKDFTASIDYSAIAKSFFTLLGTAFASAVEFVYGALKDAVVSIRDYFKGYIDEYIAVTGEDNLGSAIVMGILNGILDAIVNIGKWIYDNMFTPFIEGFKDAFEIHSPSRVMVEMGGYIVDGLINGISNIWERCKSIWEDFKVKTKNKVLEIKTNVQDSFTKMKEKIAETITGMKEKVLDTFNQLKDGIKSPINTMLNTIESFCNAVIRGINSMIEALNSVQIDAPDWVERKFGISSFGFSIPTLSEVSIPKLATGTVVPRQSKEFMAVLGDNNRETEVVSPLSTIEEAVSGVLTPYLSQLVSLTEKLVDKDLNVNIGDREIARANNRGQKALGYSLIK